MPSRSNEKKRSALKGRFGGIVNIFILYNDKLININTLSEFPILLL